MWKKLVLVSVIIIIMSFLMFNLMHKVYKYSIEVGIKVGSYKGVNVYFNGFEFAETYGKHYAKDGYYYGQKWQCVEFVKRFYHDAKNHTMPDVFGHAKDFFNKSLSQGQINKQRGMLQFLNGGNVKPEVDDLVVFNKGKYGHVAVVCDVRKDYIEVIQQNVRGKLKEKFNLRVYNGLYYVEGRRNPAGWLRLP